MDIGEYIGINYHTKYTTNELNNILSNFNNLDFGKFNMDNPIHTLLNNQDSSTIIKFIDMFKNINEFETKCCVPSHPASFRCYSLAGNIILRITSKNDYNKICVYKIMDHLLKLNMNTKAISVNQYQKITHGIDNFNSNLLSGDPNNRKIVDYMIDNYNTIQNVRSENLV